MIVLLIEVVERGIVEVGSDSLGFGLMIAIGARGRIYSKLYRRNSYLLSEMVLHGRVGWSESLVDDVDVLCRAIWVVREACNLWLGCGLRQSLVLDVR